MLVLQGMVQYGKIIRGFSQHFKGPALQRLANQCTYPLATHDVCMILLQGQILWQFGQWQFGHRNSLGIEQDWKQPQVTKCNFATRRRIIIIFRGGVIILIFNF